MYALGATLCLLGLRLWLAARVGFGDAEALYASYALHVQPAYLDHPGLIGSLARLLGDGLAPEPVVCHITSSIISCLVPWIGYWASRQLGAAPERAALAVFALMLLPELSLGLFGFTPDLLLAPLWLGALGGAAGLLRAPPGSTRALAMSIVLGVCLGLGVLSKVSMALLGIALACVFASRVGRPHLKTVAPWGALITAGCLCWPLVAWEVEQGWPMLRHRLVATQGAAGFSMRNIGALLGGQLLYVTPPFLIGLYQVMRHMRPSKGPAETLVFWTTWLPLGVLGLVCAWSRVAEPHWVGPGYLAACVALPLVPEAVGPRVRNSALAVGAAACLLGAVWVGTDLPPKLLGGWYKPRYDLANDMHAWRSGVEVTRQAISDAEQRAGGTTPVVVGPHWIICAQLQAGLQRRAPVGCRSPHGDDFRRWLPEERWLAAPQLLFVTDDRFEVDLALEFPDRKVAFRRRSLTLRGGVIVRRVEVTLLERAEATAHADPALTRYPLGALWEFSRPLPAPASSQAWARPATPQLGPWGSPQLGAWAESPAL